MGLGVGVAHKLVPVDPSKVLQEVGFSTLLLDFSLRGAISPGASLSDSSTVSDGGAS